MPRRGGLHGLPAPWTAGTGKHPPAPDDSDPLDPGHNATWRLAASDRLSLFRTEKGDTSGTVAGRVGDSRRTVLYVEYRNGFAVLRQLIGSVHQVYPLL
jgi:hypothetical protein